jgi:hypothetical protein
MTLHKRHAPGTDACVPVSLLSGREPLPSGALPSVGGEDDEEDMGGDEEQRRKDVMTTLVSERRSLCD